MQNPNHRAKASSGSRETVAEQIPRRRFLANSHPAKRKSGARRGPRSSGREARDEVSWGGGHLIPSHQQLAKIEPKRENPQRRSGKRRRRNTLRFSEVVGKTVAFVEMDWSAEFPCVEIGFEDKTALLVLMGTRLTMEPAYSDWKSGDLRELRRWGKRST